MTTLKQEYEDAREPFIRAMSYLQFVDYCEKVARSNMVQIFLGPGAREELLSRVQRAREALKGGVV